MPNQGRSFTRIEIDTIHFLREKGYSNTAIGGLIGRNESSIRSYWGRATHTTKTSRTAKTTKAVKTTKTPKTTKVIAKPLTETKVTRKSQRKTTRREARRSSK